MRIEELAQQDTEPVLAHHLSVINPEGLTVSHHRHGMGWPVSWYPQTFILHNLWFTFCRFDSRKHWHRWRRDKSTFVLVGSLSSPSVILSSTLECAKLTDSLLDNHTYKNAFIHIIWYLLVFYLSEYSNTHWAFLLYQIHVCRWLYSSY